MASKFRWGIEFIQKILNEWVRSDGVIDTCYKEPILSLEGYLSGEDIKLGIIGLRIEYRGIWLEKNFILKALEGETTEAEELSLKAGIYFFWRLCIAKAAFNPEKRRPTRNFKVCRAYFAKLIAIGALNEADVVAKILLNGLKTDFFTSKNPTSMAPFILSLFSRWKKADSNEFSLDDYPDLSPLGDVYEKALDLWDSPDMKKVEKVLKEMCAFHVDNSGWETNKKYFEFDREAYMIYPVEILALMRLRESIGLENPKIDHPIMNTPLGKLPQIREFEPDPLLQQVIKKLKTDYPQLAEIEKGNLP